MRNMKHKMEEGRQGKEEEVEEEGVTVREGRRGKGKIRI